MKVNRQSAAEAIEIIRQAQTSGRAVTVNKRGEVAFAGRLTQLVENLRARFNGNDWAAQREVEQHQRVLDAFGTAVSNDFASGNDKKLPKIHAQVVKDINNEFADDYRHGTIPEASDLAKAIATSFSRALGAIESKQNELANRALADFANNTPSARTKSLLDDVARGIEVGGGDARVELQAMKAALEARTEKLSEAYAKSTNPTDEQARDLRDHQNATIHLTEAITLAVHASSLVDDSRVPQFDGGSGRGQFGTVRFAGVDNAKNQTFDAVDGEEIRAFRSSTLAKGAADLFPAGKSAREAKEFEETQPLTEGAGIRGSQARSGADVVAANRLWANYDEGGPVNDDDEPETHTVGEIANAEVNDAEANSVKNKAQRRQLAELAAEQAAATPTKVPQKHLKGDEWLLKAEDADGPVMTALKEAGLGQDEPLAKRAVRAFWNQLDQEIQKDAMRRNFGYTPDEVGAIAKDIVAQLKAAAQS
jgi:hypothetical protein